MTTNTLKVLIVDDEAELRKNVADVLQNELSTFQFDMTEAESGERALEIFKTQDFDLVLMDVRMPGLSGLEALAQMKEQDPTAFVLIMTAHANLSDAVVAIRDGAYDYLEKPVQVLKLKQLVEKALEAKDLVTKLALSNPIMDDDIDSEFVGNSQKMKEVFELIFKLSRVDTTVLVRGENGTGKELVARAIHFNSPRKAGPFIAINCGAIPENLMESELFGHEKGAFTGAIERKLGKFQLANNGTLFLDEIGELRPEMQVKLLRVLQERKFTPIGSQREVKTNARIVAATNRNLEKMIQDLDFREDLFYRLNVMPIFLAPLRERKDDIELLVNSFIKKFAKSMNSSIRNIHPEALSALKSHSWPGNIRELENAIERAFVVESSPVIQKKSLPESLQQESYDTQKISGTLSAGASLDYEAFKEQTEKDFIIQALKTNKGKINQTVAQANIPKNTLLRKIKKYGLNPEDYKT